MSKEKHTKEEWAKVVKSHNSESLNSLLEVISPFGFFTSEQMRTAVRCGYHAGLTDTKNNQTSIEAAENEGLNPTGPKYL